MPCLWYIAITLCWDVFVNTGGFHVNLNIKRPLMSRPQASQNVIDALKHQSLVNICQIMSSLRVKFVDFSLHAHVTHIPINKLWHCLELWWSKGVGCGWLVVESTWLEHQKHACRDRFNQCFVKTTLISQPYHSAHGPITRAIFCPGFYMSIWKEIERKTLTLNISRSFFYLVPCVVLYWFLAYTCIINFFSINRLNDLDGFMFPP